MSITELCGKMKLDEAVLTASIREDLADMGFSDLEDLEIEALAGGASVRGYARVRTAGDGPETMVVMVLSDPDPAKGIEEVMAGGLVQELPFINAHRHFHECGLAVPRVLGVNERMGLVYLEDLGDEHLRDFVAKGGSPREGFEMAISELVKIQIDCTDRQSDDFIGFMASFDRELLRWELDHFVEFALDGRSPGALAEVERKRIGEIFDGFIEEMISGQYALQHRDYHMDNLLIKDGKIRVIDFQDALLGPLPYDLACLLYDRDTSYVLGKETIEGLIWFYADAYERRAGARLDRDDFKRSFDLCVIHRMLKVVGRFHFIDQVKKRPEYLRFNQFMHPVISEYLGNLTKGRELLAIIERYMPELTPRREAT